MGGMSHEEITRIAQERTVAPEEMDGVIAELKSNGCTILDCICFVMVNQRTDLAHAREVVLNSPAWLPDKEQWLQHQREMEDEFWTDK